MSTSASIGGTSIPVNSLPGCYATPPVAAAFFPAFPVALAGWQYSADGGKTFVAAIANQGHVAATSGLRQWRFSFNVPETLPNAATRDQLRIIITGDIFNAGDLNGGQLYLDGSRVAANTGTDGNFTSEWLSSLGGGTHQLLWIEGPSTIAGNTAPLFSAQIRTTQPVKIVDTITDQGVVTALFNIANVAIPRIANDQLILGDCDEVSGERAASVVKQCADVGRTVIAYGPNLLTNGDFSLSSGVNLTSVIGPGWTSGYTVGPGFQYYTAANGVTIGTTAATPLSGRALAVDVANILTQPIIQWANLYLEKGKTYTFGCDVAVMGFPFSVSVALDGVNIIAIASPALISTWTKTATNFVFGGTTGYHTVGIQSNNAAGGGNDHAFDNFELRTSTDLSTEARKPAAFELVVNAVIDQIVETANCNDDRRDIILAEIVKNTDRIQVASANILVSAFQIVNTTFNLPPGVRSFTVTAQTGTFNISFNNGGVYLLTARTGARTWGIANGVPIIASDQIRVQSPNVGSLVDIVWEV